MAATIEEIMTGIEARLATISTLRATNYAPDNPLVPCAFPLVPAFNYRQTMGRGKYTLPFRIVLLVAGQLDRVGQHKLASFANQDGASSIRAALEADKTLGGIVDDLFVESFDPTGLDDVGLAGYYGGVFTVPVHASGV